MVGSTQRWQRRTAKGPSDDASRPSDLRQALADLGRVIGDPPVDDADAAAGHRPPTG